MSKIKDLFCDWLSRRRSRKALIAKQKELKEALKQRTREGFIKKWDLPWNRFDLELLADTLREVAKIMELPNGFIYPEDELLIVAISFRWDMRDVEVIMLLEEKLNITISLEKLPLEELTMRDVICMN